MPFGPTSIQSVKSPNQRALLAQWQALAAGRLFPELGEFAAPERDLKQLILWGVEDDGQLRRFRMQKLGERALEAIAADFSGKTMDEVVPEPLRTFGLEAANACADFGWAAYSIITIIDTNAHQVDCERLLLPFGRDGAVEHIIAALQLISFQGTVERCGIAHEFKAKSGVTFRGLIAASGNGTTTPLKLPRTPRPPQATHAATANPASPAAEAPEQKAEAGRPVTEKRRAPRRVVHKTGRISARGVREICTVRDISATGAALDVVDATKVPDLFTLVLEMESAARSCAVIWRKARQLGVEFR